MSSHEKRGGQSYPKHEPFYDYVFVLFFLSGWKMSFRTGRFGVVISVGSLIWLFVCMFAWFGFPRSRGTRELLERGCVSVLGWAVSLICSFNLLVALQLREPNFSPSSSRFWPPTTFLAAPSRPRVFFFFLGFFLGRGG